MTETPLQQALAAGMKPGGNLLQSLRELGVETVECAQDAQAVCTALAQLPEDHVRDDLVCGTPLYALASLFQRVETQEAFDVLAEEGLPELLRIYDRTCCSCPERDEDMLFLLKIFAMYECDEGLARIVKAARRPSYGGSYLWSVIFGQFDEDHPLRHELLEHLRDPLPEGFACVAYLDFANFLALHDDLEDHPFAADPGVELLEGWLRESDPEQFSYARSATTSLPFVGEPERSKLLALALDHPDGQVQMEGAWAAARLGREAGIKCLARFCSDPNTSIVACTYLEELERAEVIPEACREPDFRAQAEMCHWLAHPNEYGEPPDEIRLIDTRELAWPPTRDRRQMWLFEYRYRAEDSDDEDDVGIGMVGSITFALFGEATGDLSPEEIYALHCCWELQVQDDPRAPSERTIEAGKQLLAEYARQG